MGLLDEFEQKKKEIATTEAKRPKGGRPPTHPVSCMEVGDDYLLDTREGRRKQIENALNTQRRNGKRFYVETERGGEKMRVKRLEDSPHREEKEKEKEEEWQKMWQAQLLQAWHKFKVGETRRYEITDKPSAVKMIRSISAFGNKSGWRFKQRIIPDPDGGNKEFLRVERIS